jgi:hypothetical protein
LPLLHNRVVPQHLLTRSPLLLLSCVCGFIWSADAAPYTLDSSEISCAVVGRNGDGWERVYEGSAADPWCRGYRPGLGVMNLDLLVGLPAPGPVVDAPPPVLSTWYGQWLSFFYNPQLGYISEYDPESGAHTELITTARVNFERTFSGYANVEGQGLARMNVVWDPDASCVNPSDVVVPVDVCYGGLEFPVFRLGEEAEVIRLHVRVDAQLSPSSWAQPGTNALGGWATGWGITQRLTSEASEVPEPAGATCVGLGLAALFVGWRIQSDAAHRL